MINDILNSYTREEIETLALKQLEIQKEDILKIKKINKEYKEHNKKSIYKAITNGTMILLIAGIVMTTNTKISDIGTNEILNVLNDLSDKLSALPKSEIIVDSYTKSYEILNLIVEKLGLLGIVLISKTINWIINSINDSTKSIKMKHEIEKLQEKINEYESYNRYGR